MEPVAPSPLPSLLTPLYPGYVWRFKADYAQRVKELIPPRGPAATLQGELIRSVDKLWYEAQDNGNINWGPDFDLFTDLLDWNLVGGSAGAARPPEHPATRPPWLSDDDFAKATLDLRIIRHCGRIAYRLKPEFARDVWYDTYLRDHPQIAAELEGPDELPDLAYTDSDLYKHLMDCVQIWIEQHETPIPYTPPSGFGH